MLLVAVFLLLVGSVLDGLALMLLTTPILLPLVTDLGLSPIWFGIFLVRAMEIGFVHPPIGHEPVRDPGRGAGRAAGAHLQGRGAVPGWRTSCTWCC